jgi:preprotein translocase subunit SecE
MATTTSAPQRNPFRRVAHFWSETVEELRKASWPDWLELRDSTTLVIITVCIIGSLISVADFSFYELVTFFTHLASGK